MVAVTFFGSLVTNCGDFVRVLATLDPSQLKYVRKDNSNWYLDLEVNATDLASAVAVFQSQVPSATVLSLDTTVNRVHVDCGRAHSSVYQLKANSVFLRAFSLAETRAAHESYFRGQADFSGNALADLAAAEARLSAL